MNTKMVRFPARIRKMTESERERETREIINAEVEGT
jgi:hypothetical protein